MEGIFQKIAEKREKIVFLIFLISHIIIDFITDTHIFALFFIL